MRLADLLAEDPAVEAELRALVEEIRAQLRAGTVSAADHAVAAGRDVNIASSDRAASPRRYTRERDGGPYRGRVRRAASRARLTGDIGPGSVVASHGGTAIGR